MRRSIDWALDSYKIVTLQKYEKDITSRLSSLGDYQTTV